MSSAEQEQLLTLGMSHKSAAVDLRERYALDSEGRDALRHRLATEFGIDRSCIISTCNRTELYFQAPGLTLDKDLEDAIRDALFFDLKNQDHVYRYEGWSSVIHLFRLSAGLDSMVIGETEILGQIKEAFDEAKSKGDPGRLLSDLFRQATTLGKRVRTETALGRGSLSVAAVAVKLARKVVGNLEGKSAAVLGAGETGALVARHLSTSGLADLLVLNRSLDKAEEVAAEVGGRAAGIEDLANDLAKVDVVIGCVGADQPLVDAALVRTLPRRTRVFVDISVPRSIDPVVSEVGASFAMDIDDIASLIETTKQERMRQSVEVDQLVVGEVHKFLSLQAFAGMTPLVQHIHDAFQKTRDDAVGSGLVEQEGADALTKRLLGAAMDALKESSRAHFRRDEVEYAYESYLKGDRSK